MSTYIPDLGVTEERVIEEAEDRAHNAIREPLVYQRHEERSYFADLAAARLGLDDGAEAGERLVRHGRQMEMEHRVNPNPTAGTGGEFAPPLWLNELFATAPRPGECIQRLVRDCGNEFPLPAGAGSINLPRVTKGTLVNDQTPGAPTDDQDVETASVKAQTIAYTGNSDWSLQAFEQSPRGAHLDWVVFKDMGESLDAELEADLAAGRGEAFNEALGLLNITGINIINATTETPTAIFTELAKAAAKVGVERKRPPTAWLMTTSRLQWLAMEKDMNEQRPMLLTDNVGDEWPLASMAGIALYLDDAITRKWTQTSTSAPGGAAGAGVEEPMFAVRCDDLMLWHSPVKTMVSEDVLSGSLQVRFSLWRNTASMLHRYPSGISAVIGTATKPPSGF